MKPKHEAGDVRLQTTRIHFKNILLATDFSKGSENALRAAVAMAKQFKAKLEIVNVLVPATYPPMTGGEQFLLDAQIEGATERMKSFTDEKIPADINFVIKVEWGAAIVDRLLDTVKEDHIDLIVAASHGATGIERMLLGSVAESIMRHVGVPVLIVGPNVTTGEIEFDSILLATDLSFQSLRAAQYAVSLAEEMNSSLTLMHVIEKEQNVDAVYQELERLLPEDVDNWCEPKFLVETGDVAKKVVETADLEKADLLIMATKDKHMMADHAPWSHFSHIVHSAKCPVLAVQKHL